MRRLTTAGVVALAGLAVAAPALKGPPKNSSIVGVWASESLALAADPVPESDAIFEFTAGGRLISRQADGTVLSDFPYTTDPAANPARVGWTPPGPGMVGIYQVEGDTLTLCFCSAHDGKRPTAFASPAGSRAFLMVFRRVEKK
jgi:uncharacterized protein (TIGR03067 family)